ncbi:chorismate--pyruvate lyase family protein [Mannheimia pernigra]|uniref:chorismate--pyruvate lyase family protein n=1 Tax=Mannheimia pernigra TaxID=111844 RepID=UPI00159F5335|nr:chorismate lyase [Mannheimia pernigra]QLB43859.1 chorismate lyase [Mannheimia pernigra]
MYTNYRNILSACKWKVGAGTLSLTQQEWLLHEGSLTQKLLDVTSNFNVEVVQEKWIAKNSQKMTACNEQYWRREVLLKDGDINWIFAQTLVPKKTIENIAQSVLRLGNEPIGLWLFSQQPTRTKLEWTQAENGLFARRGVYEINGYSLEIKELFLNDFLYL